MALDAKKMALTEAEALELQKVHSSALAEFLTPERPRANVVGVASGIKWKNGRPTGEPALLVLVTHKVEPGQLSAADMVPAKIEGMQTDVLQVGTIFAGGCGPQEAGSETLAKRLRPAKGGYSVGHVKITAGTIATGVYDILTDGVGMPPKYYILSNNHVLANSNAATPGDPILQPGPYDGGVFPADQIASLSRFIPINFVLPATNLIDAAVAEVQFHDLDREVYWIGYTRGWRPKQKVAVGTFVQKTGRTSNYTVGRITAINATIDVNYGGGHVARFVDQIVTTPMSAPGDSGSLVTTLDEVAVGLLFAGSTVATILNQIENVRSLLRVEVAEQIL